MVPIVSPSGMSGLDTSSPYYKFLMMEHEQILKNKWYISERLGKDCGMDYAVWDWYMRVRHVWVSGLKRDGTYPL